MKGTHHKQSSTSSSLCYKTKIKLSTPMGFPRAVSSKPDWAYLPENLLYIILTELFLLSDLISFGSVCRNWRSLCQQRFREMNIRPNMFIRGRLPMLLIPTDSAGTRNLYSLPDGEVYDLKLPVPYDTRCIGSSHGWLIFLERLTYVVTLFNPFYFGNGKGTIKLPPFLAARDAAREFFQSESEYESSPELLISKAILSADPVSCPNYTVMLIYGQFRCLAYYKSGDETWTCIPGNPRIHDLIYFDGCFTAISFWGELYTSDPEANRPQLEFVTKQLYCPFKRKAQRYIMMSNDGNTLLQVVRHVVDVRPNNHDNALHFTLSFSVCKLERQNETFKWLELSSIGDAALFVGHSYSYCVRASAYPGIIPNSIYYTDDFRGFESMYNTSYELHGGLDNGVFTIGDGSLRSHYDPGDKLLISPIWILPTF